MNRFLVCLFPFLVVAVVVGCNKSGEPPTASVKGTVTYNGKPIDKGQVTFALEGRPPSIMEIADGKFTGKAMVGSNKVSVSAKRKDKAPTLSKGAETQIKGYQQKFKGAPGEFGGPSADYDPTMVEYIPADWGVHSKQMRTVEASGANDFNLDVKGPELPK